MAYDANGRAALAQARRVYEELLAAAIAQDEQYPGENVDLDDQRQTVLDLALQVIDAEEETA